MLKTTVLIVEDEAMIAEDLREQLVGLGHTVVGVVDTAEDAIAAASEKAPGLVLMDIRLRGESDGIDAATIIGESSDVPIVYMTAHSDADTVARAMLVRPYGYVVKPVRDSDLVTAIQTALLRHAAEERLRACEAQSRALVEHATDLVLQILPDGRMLSGNPAARHTLGYSPSQLCRLPLSELVAPGDRESLSQLLVRAIKEEGGTRFRLTLVARDGRPVPVDGVLGRRHVGNRLDRLWAVLHPTAETAPDAAGGSGAGPHDGEPQPELAPVG